jgi:hypothetical protein
VAGAVSDLSAEHELMQSLRADLNTTGTNLVAVGYAELRFGAGAPR